MKDISQVMIVIVWNMAFCAGIVKAVDMKRGVYYISTPVPQEQLQHVDILLQGRVEIPVPLLTVRDFLTDNGSHNVKFYVPWSCAYICTTISCMNYMSKARMSLSTFLMIVGLELQARGYICPYLSKKSQIVEGVGAGAMRSTMKPSAKKVL